MSSLERTRTFRLKTIYALVLTVFSSSTAVWGGIAHLVPEFMLKNSLLIMSGGLFGMSICLGFGLYLMATEQRVPRRKISEES